MDKVKGSALAEQKSARVRIKSTDDDTGRFRAVVSVFGNVDAYGDVMMPGAFAKSLERYKAAGDDIPYLWDHDTGDPFSYVGGIDEAFESAEGLEVAGTFDLDNPTAAQVYRLVKARRVKEWSFGFIVPEGGWKIAEKDGTTVRELHEVELLEVSTTLVGANRATRTIEVRSAPGEPLQVAPAADDEDDSPEGGGDPEVKADGGNTDVGLPALSAATVDEAAAALQGALDALDTTRGTIVAALETLKATASNLDKGNEHTEDKGAEATTTEDDEHAAASSVAAVDEAPEGKSTAKPDAAAATARDLETKLAIFNLERKLKP